MITVLDGELIIEMQSTTQALFSRSEVVHRPAFPVSHTLTGYGYAWYTMQYRGECSWWWWWSSSL